MIYKNITTDQLVTVLKEWYSPAFEMDMVRYQKHAPTMIPSGGRNRPKSSFMKPKYVFEQTYKKVSI